MRGAYRKHRRITRTQWHNWVTAYLFLAPWLTGMLLLVVYQVGVSLFFSFSNVSISDGLKMSFAGWDNYAGIFQLSANYLLAVGEFALLTLIRTPVIVSFALMMALLINRPFRGRTVYRVLLFLPVVIASGPVIPMLTSQGMMAMPAMDTAALSASVEGLLPSWLSSVVTNLFTSLMTLLWNSGVQILLFLSGLQKMPRAMYDAAKIDGASAWECLWKVTLPILRPIILLASVFTIVNLSAQPGNATIGMIVSAMYGLDLNRGYGYASAMAWIYLVVVAVLLLIAWLLLRSREPAARQEYEGVYRRR